MSFQDCSFSMRKGRESTARVVVAKELGILNSYTLEGTFAGPNFGALKDMHMNGNHFQEMGHALCDSILDYYIPNRESGLLNEDVGLDGISISAKCAHSTHKHAKPALRRYIIPGEETSSSSSSANNDVQNKDIISDAIYSDKVSKKHGGVDDDSGNESPTEVDDIRNAPPSPEVLAEVATDPDGSPSNTKVLEALLSDESCKDAARRRSSANIGKNISLDNMQGSGVDNDIDVDDDECDDIDSGSDNEAENELEFDNASITEVQTHVNDQRGINDQNDGTSALLNNTSVDVEAEVIEELIEVEVGYNGSKGVITSTSTSNRRTFTRRHSLTSSEHVNGEHGSLISGEQVSCPQLVLPSTALLRNNANPTPPFSGNNMNDSSSSSENSSSGGGGGVSLPRSIVRGSSGGSDSMWSSGGGGGAFWADAVNENGMLVSSNSKRPSLLSVGTNADGTSLRPRSGSRYRQQLTNSPPKGLTQLGFELGLPSVSLLNDRSSDRSSGGASNSVGERVSLSRPPRPSSLPSTAVGSSASVGGISISSRGPAASVASSSATGSSGSGGGGGAIVTGSGSKSKDAPPRLSSGAALNVMRGSLRVKDSTTTSILSPKVPSTSKSDMTTSQRLSFRRMNSSHAPKGSSLLNG